MSGRAAAGCLAVVGVSLALASPTSEASPKAPVVFGYPYARACPAAGLADRVDRWKMFTCNCTSFAAWALDRNGQRIDWFVPGQMDAHNWPAVARGARIPTGATPRVGAVAVWPRLAPPYGHLAYVIGVHDDGSFDVAEYNLVKQYRFGERLHLGVKGATFVYVPRR
jgi:surface antigen